MLVMSNSTPCDPWTVAHQAPLSLECSRQEYWSEQPFPTPAGLLDLGMEARFPASQADFSLLEPPGTLPRTRIYDVKFLI